MYLDLPQLPAISASLGNIREQGYQRSTLAKICCLCNLTTRVLRYLAIWQTYMKYIIYKNCRNAIKWRVILAVVNATYAIAKEAWKKIQDFNKISRPQYSIKYSIPLNERLIAMSRVQIELKPWFFFSGFFRNCINCVQNCEDYSSVDYFAIS